MYYNYTDSRRELYKEIDARHHIQTTENDIRHAVAFTGYRPGKLPFGYDINTVAALKLRDAIEAEIRRLHKKGFTDFFTGCALGSDLLAAETVISLSNNLRVTHVAYIPCKNHTLKWNEVDKLRLKKILKSSGLTILVNNREYFNGCMQIRNEYMVDTSSVLVAIYDGKPGGTRNTIDYALKRRHKVIIIDPSTLERTELCEPGQKLFLF